MKLVLFLLSIVSVISLHCGQPTKLMIRNNTNGPIAIHMTIPGNKMGPKVPDGIIASGDQRTVNTDWTRPVYFDYGLEDFSIQNSSSEWHIHSFINLVGKTERFPIINNLKNCNISGIAIGIKQNKFGQNVLMFDEIL